VLSLEQAVHMLTARPAEVFGLSDRGLLAEGRPAGVPAAAPPPVPPKRSRSGPAAKARERVRLGLDLALDLCRERLAFQSGIPPEELSAGTTIASLPPVSRLEEGLEKLMECRADVDRNLGPEAILDRALLVLRP